MCIQFVIIFIYFLGLEAGETQHVKKYTRKVKIRSQEDYLRLERDALA